MRRVDAIRKYFQKCLAGRIVDAPEQQTGLFSFQIVSIAAVSADQKQPLHASHVITERESRLTHQRDGFPTASITSAIANENHSPLASENIRWQRLFGDARKRNFGQRDRRRDEIAAVGAACRTQVHAVVQNKRQQQWREKYGH